ncbi:MAG: calcium/proton exchanger [gamma proteobacterium symbiont of Taylorina sp.]|nr:calcium/proton exchanger [gamma proteobacterium symbiont of Taylorina sp.]
MNLYLLLIFIPVTLCLDWFEANPTLIFVCSGLTIVLLADLLGKATESISAFIGPTLGGLLAATMGNAPELIISLSALKAGLYEVVKAAITGSIVGNLLLGVGLAIFLGGLGREKLEFNRTSTGMSSGLLMLASVGLIVPAISHFTTGQKTELSTEIAIVLFVAYLLSLVFTLKTHKHLFQAEVAKPADGRVAKEVEENLWGKKQAIGILVAVSVGIAFMSETLTGAIEPAAESLHFTPIFAGVIFLAFFGNASDLMNAVRFARKNQMELSMGIAVGASTQLVMFVVPVLIFASYFIGPKPLDLLFVPFEIAAIVIAVLINRSLTADGESHWMEGVMLLGVYLILAIGFFFLPV